MIDLRALRADPDAVRASQRARGDDPALVDALLAADEARRAAVSIADNLRAELKTASQAVGRAMGAVKQGTGTDEDAQAARDAATLLSDQVAAAEADQTKAEAALRTAHLAIANVVIG